MLYLIFSSFKKNIRSLSQTDIEGGCGEVQDNNTLHRASNDAKATTLACLWLRGCHWDETPKMAIRGQTSKLILRMSDIVLKKEFQKFCSLGQSANIWLRLHGESLHFSHMSGTLGYILDSLLLERWALWTTLNCMKLSLAQDVVVRILSNTLP